MAMIRSFQCYDNKIKLLLKLLNDSNERNEMTKQKETQRRKQRITFQTSYNSLEDMHSKDSNK